MTNYFPLADCANVLCTSVDLLVASCNKMAPITVSVRYSFKSITNRLIMTILLFHDLKPRDFFLESELTPDNIDNREDAIKYINRCIDECKNRREG